MFLTCFSGVLLYLVTNHLPVTFLQISSPTSWLVFTGHFGGIFLNAVDYISLFLLALCFLSFVQETLPYPDIAKILSCIIFFKFYSFALYFYVFNPPGTDLGDME